MRWRGRRASVNVEDRRGRSPMRRGGAVGCGGLLLVLAFAAVTGYDPVELLQLLGEAQQASLPPSTSYTNDAPSDELSEFSAVVLADTEVTWRGLFTERNRRYEEPTLVLFSDAVQSACGFTSAAVGPFYCPGDHKVYLDLSFFDEMSRRLGAPGDFAQAYVIAHEVGHHVQNLLGISDQVHRAQQRSSEREANQLSVALELQADCLAGVWAYHAHTERQLLEPGDIEEGLNAAYSIGDDVLQRRAGAAVRPESWTHGSSGQRQGWLRRGLESGDPAACDTFQPAGGEGS